MHFLLQCIQAFECPGKEITKILLKPDGPVYGPHKGH